MSLVTNLRPQLFDDIVRFRLLLPTNDHDGDGDISMGFSERKIVITAAITD